MCFGDVLGVQILSQEVFGCLGDCLGFHVGISGNMFYIHLENAQILMCLVGESDF